MNVVGSTAKECFEYVIRSIVSLEGGREGGRDGEREPESERARREGGTDGRTDEVGR